MSARSPTGGISRTQPQPQPEQSAWRDDNEAEALIDAIKGTGHSVSDPAPVHKTPDMVLPGDIVIPTRGRYAGLQCEVKDVLRGKYATYRLKVVPTVPTADEWGVDYTERIRVVAEGRTRS